MTLKSPQNQSVDALIELTAQLQKEIAARQKLERKMAAQTEELRFLNALNDAANHGKSLAEITQLLSDGVSRLLNAKHMTVSYVNDDRTVLVTHTNTLPRKLLQKIETLLGFKLPRLKINLTPDSIFTRLLASGEPVLVDTPTQITRLMEEYADSNLPPTVPQIIRQKLYNYAMEFLQIDTIIICPLSVGDISIGALTMKGQKTFTSEDLARVKRIAVQLSGIIQRKRAEMALQESRNLYISLVESLPQAVFRKDRAGHFIYVNRNFCKMSGHSPEQLLGKTDFVLHPEELARKYRADDEFVMRTGKPLEVIEERQTINKPHHTQFVRTIKAPLYNTAGEIIGMQGVFEDITLQKENELRLEQNARQLDLLHQIDHAILAAKSPPEIAEATLKILLEMIPSPRASILLMDEKQGMATILAAAGKTIPENFTSQTEIPLEKLGIYHRFKQNPEKVILITFAEQGGTVEAELKQHGIAISINAMLTVDGELVGSLNIGFAQPDDIQHNYTQIMEQIADSLAVALKQSHLTELIRADAAIKTRLLQEVDHRVKNNLASIMSMLFLENRFAKGENAAASSLKNMRRRVQSLSALHELLSANQWEPLPMHALLSRIVNAAYRGAPGDIELIPRFSVPDDIHVPAATAQNLSILITELVGNTLQHALPQRSRCQIDISTQTNNGEITLIYHDDGPGYPDSILAENNGHVGMALIRNTVSMGLHGKLLLENDSGAKTTVRFPAPTV